mmetsp:Transcript_17621/g.38374  ORF Transcript_17621/g.38374 Transcript_17621/m.38374 type:complete len:233 (-) Transcript_17621:87-785(-)
MPCVLDDRDHVRTGFSHVDKIAPGAVGELNRVHYTRRSHDVGHVRHSGACRCANVENLASGTHIDIVNAAENSRRQLRAEGIPDPVLELGGCPVRAHGSFNLDALLSVDVFAGGGVQGDKGVLFGARDEDALVPVRLDDHLGPALHAASPAATTAAPTIPPTTTAAPAIPTAPSAASSAISTATPTTAPASRGAPARRPATPASWCSSASAEHFLLWYMSALLCLSRVLPTA